ncbi:MAG: putative Ig domain-containing protein [Gammaproteobacteria bacterium]
MRKSKLITTLEAPGILLVFLLAGCGGGGGDAPGTATATTPANTPATAAGPSTPGVPVTPDAPTMALSITNTSPATYQWGVLTEGQELYVDRTYVFTSVPATHQSLDYLKTANDDKTASGMPFVSFDVNTPVTVYVAYHTQIATLPAWLQSWDDTGDMWSGTDGDLRVFARTFPAGSVSLGGNEMGGSMYSVAVRESSGGALAIGGTPAASATAGLMYNFVPSVSGGTGGTRTFSAQNLPSWASIDSSTGAMTGTPAVGDVGTYPGIVISVSDGQASAAMNAFAVDVVGSSTGSVTVSWTAPTLNADGTPLVDLAGYRIYYGPSAGNYPNSQTVNNPGVTTSIVENLAPGVWAFVITAFDIWGNESEFSSVASTTVAAP